MSGILLEALQQIGASSDMRMLMKHAHLTPEYLASFAGNSKLWRPEKAVA